MSVTTEFLKEHIDQLAGVCDHASTRDGLGFSKASAPLGHLIASLSPEDINEELQDASLFLVRLHSRQLGVDTATLPEPSEDRLANHTASIVRPTFFMKDDKCRLWTPKKNPLYKVAMDADKSFLMCRELPVGEGALFEFETVKDTYTFFDVIFNIESMQRRMTAKEGHWEMYMGEYEDVSFTFPIMTFLEKFTENELIKLDDAEALILYVPKLEGRKSTKPLFVSLSYPNRFYDELVESKLVDEISENRHAFFYETNRTAFPDMYESRYRITKLPISTLRKLSKKNGYDLHIVSESSEADIEAHTLHHINKELEEKRKSHLITFNTDSKDVWVRFPYKDTLVDLMRTFSSAAFRREAGVWIVNLSPENIDYDSAILDTLVEKGFCWETPAQASFNKFVKKLKSGKVKQAPKNVFKYDQATHKLAINFDDHIQERVQYIKDVVPQNLRSYESHSCTWFISLQETHDSVGLIETIRESELQWDWDFDVDHLINKMLIDAIDTYMDADKQLELSGALSVDSFEKGADLCNGSLYPFQYVVPAYSDFTKRILLADDRGIGKTLEALATMEHQGTKHNLIVCPHIAAPTWEHIILQFLPDVDESQIIRYRSKHDEFSTEQLSQAKYVIIYFDILSALTEKLVDLDLEVFDSITVDESHKLKRPQSKRSTAAKTIVEFHRPSLRMLLSGTALTGKPKDLLNQLDLLGILDTHFGGFYQFAVDFCDGRRNDAGFFEYDGSSNEQELHRKLSQTCMVRRIKRNVLPDLPTKQRSVVYAEISNRAKYEKAEKDFISAIRANIEERAVKAVTVKLEQQKAELKKDYKAPTKERFAELVAAEASSITFRTESASNLTEFTVLKKIANEGKERGAIEWVKNYFEDADDSMPLVAFPYTRKLQKKMYEACIKAGLRVGSITADQTADERFEQQQRFQNGEFDVMVASLMIASTNLTLTAASTAFFPELTDNADDFVQAEDRILRIGSEGDSVECAYLFADNTVDIDIWERHTNKVQVMDLVMDGEIVENDMTKLESKYLSKLIEQAAA